MNLKLLRELPDPAAVKALLPTTPEQDAMKARRDGEVCDILKQKPLVVMKKSKRSEEEKDISGLIAQVEPTESGIRALLCSSTSESLNPRLLMAALEKYAPDLKLGPVTMARGRFYPSDGKEFK